MQLSRGLAEIATNLDISLTEWQGRGVTAEKTQLCEAIVDRFKTLNQNASETELRDWQNSISLRVLDKQIAAMEGEKKVEQEDEGHLNQLFQDKVIRLIDAEARGEGADLAELFNPVTYELRNVTPENFSKTILSLYETLKTTTDPQGRKLKGDIDLRFKGLVGSMLSNIKAWPAKWTTDNLKGIKDESMVHALANTRMAAVIIDLRGKRAFNLTDMNRLKDIFLFFKHNYPNELQTCIQELTGGNVDSRFDQELNEMGLKIIDEQKARDAAKNVRFRI